MNNDDLCCCPPEAGKAVCDLPAQDSQRPTRVANVCPQCARTAKSVQGQTVKALLSASLRIVENVEYFFCRTQTCPVVYFTSNGSQTLTVNQIRERVYQKEPDADEALICYCFQHTIGDVRRASPQGQRAILDDINVGIEAGQCACDLRNPQGSCCLGNVRGLIKQLEHQPISVT